jgi:hypothetical protein
MAKVHTPVAVVCISCRKPTSSKPAGWLSDYDGEVGHALVRCSHCGQLMVITQSFTHDDYGEWIEDGPPSVLLPSPDASLSPATPEAPRRSFEEARACFRAGQYTASALMVRRTLEAVCNDKGATGTTLYARLDDLKTKQVIEGRLADWSHGLRALGNDAAHDTSVFVDSDDAKDALQLAEALLAYAYVLNARYEAFKARRSASAMRAASAPQINDPPDSASAGPFTA